MSEIEYRAATIEEQDYIFAQNGLASDRSRDGQILRLYSPGGQVRLTASDGSIRVQVVKEFLTQFLQPLRLDDAVMVPVAGLAPAVEEFAEPARPRAGKKAPKAEEPPTP